MNTIPDENVVLEFEHFGFKYDAQAEPTLYDIDLKVHKGEKILIAGPSGCGKSTLVHAVNGLIPCSYKGEITGCCKISGKDTRKMSIFDISLHVGTVLQDQDSQFIGMTVAEDIAFALENDCVETDEMHRRVKEMADTVDIGTHLRHAPEELSGGQKQRVSLAGVLVDDVDILLFDEPLANLDPATGKQAIELIDEIGRLVGGVSVYLAPVLKCAAIGVVTKLAAELCREASQSAIASGVELAGTICALGTALPLIMSALRMIGSMV